MHNSKNETFFGTKSVLIKASTVADTSDGNFRLIGLEEGSYNVSVDPRNDSYQSASLENVDVSIGETNDIGTVELSSD